MNQVIIDTKDNQKYIFSGKGIKVGFIFVKNATQITISAAKTTKVSIFDAEDIKKISITNKEKKQVNYWANNKWQTQPMKAGV